MTAARSALDVTELDLTLPDPHTIRQRRSRPATGSADRLVVSATQVRGRPIGVAIANDGSLFVTEDGNGTIWRISHR